MHDYMNRAERNIFFHERNYRRDGQFYHSDAHYHRQMEIFYLLEGSVVIVVDSKAFHVEKGGILVIPPLLTHSSIYSNAHNSRMVINCSMNYFPPELAASVDAPFYVERHPESEGEIDSLFRIIREEYDGCRDYGEMALVNSISLLTILLLRACCLTGKCAIHRGSLPTGILGTGSESLFKVFIKHLYERGYRYDRK